MLRGFDRTTMGRLLQAGGPLFLPPAMRRGFFRLVFVFLCASAGVLPLSAAVCAAQTSTASSPAHPVAKKKKAASTKSRRQLAPEPARIKEIQQALAREGFYQGEPTGKWDDATVTAMKNFQESKGLQPTGKIEALSLQKLGLGSPVAGIAPPNTHSPSAATPAPATPQKP